MGCSFPRFFFDFSEDHPSHTVDIHELKSYVTGSEKNWFGLGDLRVSRCVLFGWFTIDELLQDEIFLSLQDNDIFLEVHVNILYLVPKFCQ